MSQDDSKTTAPEGEGAPQTPSQQQPAQDEAQGQGDAEPTLDLGEPVRRGIDALRAG